MGWEGGNALFPSPSHSPSTAPQCTSKGDWGQFQDTATVGWKEHELVDLEFFFPVQGVIWKQVDTF